MRKEHEILFRPIRIGGVELKNRYVMSPMADFGLVDAGGIPTDAGVEYFVTRARGGIGLILTGACYVDDTVEKVTNKTLMCTERTDKWLAMQQYSRMAERIHAYGAKLFVQLGAGYGRSAHVPESAGEAVAPSAIPNRWDPRLIHRPAETEEVERIVRAFGEAAAFFRRCGVDGVEVHAVHEGYLLDQFTMECFNRRTDRYGGSFENRCRFAVEIVQEIKARCGTGFPVSLRYTPKHYMKGLLQGAVAGEEFTEMGRDLPEGIRMARRMEQAGYDALNVDLGCYDAHYWNHPSVYQKDGLYLEAAEAVKHAVGIPVIAAGRMDDPDLGAAAIRAGKCDMVALGRPCLAEPEIPNKVAREEFARIRPCISCNYGCCTKVHQDAARQGCAVNAQCARELETVLTPAAERKRFVVVGGGPGGCECARVLALRGHQVTLLEKSGRLGGALNVACRPGFKHHDTLLIRWFQAELERLGVEVRLDTPAEPETVRALAPDGVITATGAAPFVPPIAGISAAITAERALLEPESVGKDAVIIGAGQVGVETGLWLLEQGRSVTVVEATERFMPQALYSDAEHAKALLDYYGGRVLLGVCVEEIGERLLRLRGADGRPVRLEPDTVILAAGYRADPSVYERLRKEFPIVYNIGDSVRSRNIYYAVHEAYELASHL